jgi:hypothetical protein
MASEDYKNTFYIKMGQEKRTKANIVEAAPRGSKLLLCRSKHQYCVCYFYAVRGEAAQ